MVRERGEPMAGEWLAAPAGGQWLRCSRRTRDRLRDVADDLCGAVCRAVVEDDDFEFGAVTACKTSAQRGGDIGLFVARGNKDGAAGARGAGVAVAHKAGDCAKSAAGMSGEQAACSGDPRDHGATSV